MDAEATTIEADVPATAGRGFARHLGLSGRLFLLTVGFVALLGLAALGARVPAGDLAGANAAFVVLYNVGLMLGPPLIGGGLDLLPSNGFAGALGLLFLAYAGALAVTERRARP